MNLDKVLHLEFKTPSLTYFQFKVALVIVSLFSSQLMAQSETMAREKYQSGKAAYEAEDWSKVILEMDSALRLTDSKSLRANCHYARGYAYYKLDSCEQAVLDMRNVIKAIPPGTNSKQEVLAKEIIALCTISSQVIVSQSTSPTFDRCYNFFKNDMSNYSPRVVMEVPGGGFVVIGNRENPIAPWNHAFVLKTDRFGNTEWIYEDRAWWSWAYGCVLTRDSSILICGSGIDSTAYVTSEQIWRSTYLVKLSLAGSVEWSRISPHEKGKDKAYYAVSEFPGENIRYVAVGASTPDSGFADGLIDQLSMDGARIFSKIATCPSNVDRGSPFTSCHTLGRDSCLVTVNCGGATEFLTFDSQREITAFEGKSLSWDVCMKYPGDSPLKSYDHHPKFGLACLVDWCPSQERDTAVVHFYDMSFKPRSYTHWFSQYHNPLIRHTREKVRLCEDGRTVILGVSAEPSPQRMTLHILGPTGQTMHQSEIVSSKPPTNNADLYDDYYPANMMPTNDGGFVITGYRLLKDQENRKRLFIVKTNSMGELE